MDYVIVSVTRPNDLYFCIHLCSTREVHIGKFGCSRHQNHSNTNINMHSKIQDVLVKARALLNKHGLNDWGLKIDRAKKHAGVCCYDDKTIQLSKVFILSKKTTDEKIEDVILHEIAHAIVGPITPYHGKHWQDVAKKIGCSGNRYVSPFVLPKWRFQCLCGNVRGYRFNIHWGTISRRVCSSCNTQVKVAPYTYVPLKQKETNNRY